MSFFTLNKKSKNIVALFISICFFAIPIYVSAFTISKTGTVRVDVQNCNNDSVCEELLGETWYGCPLDCAAPVSTSTATVTDPVVIGSTAVSTINKEGYRQVVEVFKRFFGNDYFERPENRPKYQNTYINQGKNTIDQDNIALVPAPSNLRLKYESGEVILTWDYVSNQNIRFRIQRNTDRYPADYLSGKLIYEGRGNYARDTAVVPGKEYYYSVYAILNKGKGNSAPLIAKIKIPEKVYKKENIKVDPLIDDVKSVELEPLTGKDLLCDTYFVPQTNVGENISLKKIIKSGYKSSENIIVSQDSKISVPVGGVYNLRGSPMVISLEKLYGYDDKSVVGLCLYRLNSDENVSSYLFDQNSNSQRFFLVLSPKSIEKYRKQQYIFNIRMVKYNSNPTTIAQGILEINGTQNFTERRIKYTEFVEPLGTGLLRFLLRKTGTYLIK